MTEWERSYSLAFLRQAQSDFRVHDMLSRADVEVCQVLHYVQMAFEKAAKAHLWRSGAGGGDGDEPSGLLWSHAVIGKVIPQVIRHYWATTKQRLSSKQKDSKLRAFRGVLKEIEILAPAVDKANRPENCEYPWVVQRATGRAVLSPLDVSFPAAELLRTTAGREVVKILKTVVQQALQ